MPLANWALRNSRGNLVASGKHILWDYESATDNDDGGKGSFQPNIFGYDFTSPDPQPASIQVIVQPLNIELIGAEAIVYGALDGNRVFQTDFFFFKNLDNTELDAYLIKPSAPNMPFRVAGDIVWSMELRRTQQPVTAKGPDTTRLELYGTSRTAHPRILEWDSRRVSARCI